MYGAMSLTCQLCCAVFGHTLSTLPASAACSPNTYRALPFSYSSRSGSRPEAGTASCNSILGSPRTGNPSQIFLQAHICLICRSCPLQKSALIRITFFISLRFRIWLRFSAAMPLRFLTMQIPSFRSNSSSNSG